MPGFLINGIGANRTNLDHESRFYASYSWDITSIFQNNNFLSFSGGSLNYYAPVKLALKTAQLPSVSFDQVKSKGGAQEYKFAGKPNYDNIKVSFYDTLGLIDIIKEWSNSVFNVQQGIRTANNYKFNTRIVKYLMDREDQGDDAAENEGSLPDGIVIYDLYGSWPVMIKESDLTYVEASIKTIELSISYDHFIVSNTDKPVDQLNFE